MQILSQEKNTETVLCEFVFVNFQDQGNNIKTENKKEFSQGYHWSLVFMAKILLVIELIFIGLNQLDMQYIQMSIIKKRESSNYKRTPFFGMIGISERFRAILVDLA